MRLAWIASLLLVAGWAGCGSMSDEERFSLTTPGTDDLVVREIQVEDKAKARTGRPTADEVAVIRGWADALRKGRVNEAADYFEIPAVVENGTGEVSLETTDDVRNFNRLLPCGAKLMKTARADDSFVLATFELTERPGPGECGAQSVGTRAKTSFLIEDRHIVQWMRTG
jgi:hypothetical protein